MHSVAIASIMVAAAVLATAAPAINRRANFYTCAYNGFRCYCSVDPCAISWCPDYKPSTYEPLDQLEEGHTKCCKSPVTVTPSETVKCTTTPYSTPTETPKCTTTGIKCSTVTSSCTPEPTPVKCCKPVKDAQVPPNPKPEKPWYVCAKQRIQGTLFGRPLQSRVVPGLQARDVRAARRGS